MELNGSLTIDKTPGSSDMESTLTLLAQVLESLAMVRFW
jgi:hypothetical protein